MTITLDAEFRVLSNSDSTVHEGQKGFAHSSYFALTTVQNLNYCVAAKTAPVLMTFHAGTSDEYPWAEDSGSAVMGPRGKCVLWRPHSKVTLRCKSQASSGQTGTITCSIYPGPVNSGVSSVSGTITNSNDAAFTEDSVELSDIVTSYGRMCHIYIYVTYATLLSAIIYAEPYDG